MEENFTSRHIGLSKNEEKEVLKTLNYNSTDELIQDVIPKHIRLQEEFELPSSISESEVLKEAELLAKQNNPGTCMIGQGYYPTYTPAVIQRNILENPSWYTQYTPYQAEISQGRLEALFNFQTLICNLTGMDVANASLLDEGTAAAEAMMLAWNLSKKSRENKNTFIVSRYCYNQTIDVLKTRSEVFPFNLKIADEYKESLDDVFGMLIQYPRNSGEISSTLSDSKWLQQIKEKKVSLIACADLLSLTLLSPPGHWGADIVVGSSQRFGIPLGFGGPHAAFFATKKELQRLIPGRIIGLSIDKKGNPALRMALQTREQHIRREQATSNICTAQVLLAIMASMYAIYHGKEGLVKIALTIHNKTTFLYQQLIKKGLNIVHSAFFDTLIIKVDSSHTREEIKSRAEEKWVHFFYPKNDPTHILLSVDETTSLITLANVVSIFIKQTQNVEEFKQEFHKQTKQSYQFPKDLLRSDDFLTHPVFQKYHTETALLRYMKFLERKDLSLTHSMISLGSCTMKLNGTTEMMPLSWSNFSQLHPFLPLKNARGYLNLFQELENALNNITGFVATSLQPNSGAQGEYAGLMAIKKYHESQSDDKRNVILIPSSSHGTNPASASMCNMTIVIIPCRENGDIDVEILKEKAKEYKENLAGLMITYPSTHGVFEEEIQEIYSTIHKHGGLIYMDGANMNAQIGLTHPGKMGADVCHLNLHKTFCIPHGGGGPGVGPICVNEKLAPFLPGHIYFEKQSALGGISSAPWGSASILLISWSYIKMMSFQGLKKCGEIAILSANYLMERLKNHYPILYTNKKKRVAHEFIIDIRPFKSKAEIEVEDIAKRLIDYGFHAPTVSFPIPGTLMIEPTESENLDELNRFCEAMISIREEIKLIEDGTYTKEDNPLKNSPHTEQDFIEDWDHCYSKETAVYPLSWVKENKFWPCVSRINNTYGDKNLICSCPSIKDYK